MAKIEITPRSVEREFHINELFFSTTDEKGIITSGNDVFVRVSDWTLEELLGAPHNQIRHPDMPRTVFKLLWDYIQAGKTIAAYVKNMAHDGAYYWVVAVVAPIPGGYLSVRFKPSSAFYPIVQELYAEMRNIERECGERGDARKQGMDQAAAKLVERLNEAGFESYDAFMRAMLKEELKSRDERIAAEKKSIIPDLVVTNPEVERGVRKGVVDLYNIAKGLYGDLSALYNQLDDFVNFNDQLGDKSDFILALARGFRLISLNTAVRSAKLGERGVSLAVIAEHMADASKGIGVTVEELTEKISRLTGEFRTVIFNLAVARLQLEMIMYFCAELAEGRVKTLDDDSKKFKTVEQMINDLQTGFRDSFLRSLTALFSARDESRDLDTRSETLRKTVVSLRFTQLSGTVEAFRIDEGLTFGVIFEEVRSQLERARDELTDLTGLLTKIQMQIGDVPKVAKAMEGRVGAADRTINDLQANA